MIPGQRNRWYVPAQRREEQRALKHEADRILTNDRRRSRRQARREEKPATESPAAPRRFTLSDLPALRKKGLVP